MVLPIAPQLLLVIAYLLFAYFLGMVGRDYKFGFWGNFLLSVILTPVMGLIIVLAQDRRPMYIQEKE